MLNAILEIDSEGLLTSEPLIGSMDSWRSPLWTL